MYEDVFDEKKQISMRHYFLNELSDRGVIRHYKKKQTIDCELARSSFGIVVRGKVAKSILSFQGCERLLYTMRPGEIFGEMNLFCGGGLNFLIRAKEDAEVSYIGKEVLQAAIEQNSQVYQCIINSITRKYRIILLQLTNNTFNDSTGRIADALIRLSACSDTLETGQDPRMISTLFTQGELAHNVGCSRITVTRVLKKFMAENLIGMKNKKIVINDMDALAAYTDRVQ